MLKRRVLLPFLCLIILFSFSSCAAPANSYKDSIKTINDVPQFSNYPYVAINENQPDFTKDEITNHSFERYSELDSLGRCGVAYACIGSDIMPTEERGSIGQIKPSGWHTVKYDIVDGKYLYNRCHLIGFQLTGENANERNLITGTRFMNVDGMLPFENMVADYVKETDNHVLYRVTPIYDGEALLARGVQIEALSVEDDGEGICFNVYVYNSQPGIVIDYNTGESALKEEELQVNSSELSKNGYVLNTSSKKFHTESCSGAKDIKAENRSIFSGNREELLDSGYSPCKRCNP